MTRTLLAATTAIAIAILPSAAPAQQAAHGAHSAHSAHADTAKGHTMKSPCPLHLTGLNTTPAQDSALARVREAHMAEMKTMHASHGADAAHASMPDSAMNDHMKASMARALDGMRAVLGDTQRQQLDAAASAHAAEKAEMAKHGMAHDCAACCREHHAKREGGAQHQH